MSLSADEQVLFDFAKGSLPRWFTSSVRAMEELGAFVKVFNRARQQTVFWASQTYIKNAVGAATGEPDWLEQHARDRGTSRQDGEDDAALRARLRNREDMLIRSALLALILSMLEAAGVVDPLALPVPPTWGLVELRRDRAFFGDFFSAYGAIGGGGAYHCDALGGGAMEFTLPAGTLWPTPPFQPAPAKYTFKLTLISGGSPTNDGTFVITGLDGDKAKYTNLSGATQTVPGDSEWSVTRYDQAGHQLTGFARSYLSRGYRMSGTGRLAGLVAILPYGSSEALRLAVLEALRTRKAAGMPLAVERRLNP